MAANTAFSSPEDDVISRTIEVEREDVPIDEDFDAYYDILRTVEEISNGNYKRVRRLTHPTHHFRRLTVIYLDSLAVP